LSLRKSLVLTAGTFWREKPELRRRNETEAGSTLSS
jgi:hypothetical protein